MKKILSFTILMGSLLLGATSCTNEEELLFNSSAAERLNEASELYTKSVAAAENGWALEYYPQSSTSEDNPVFGVGYLMMAQFNKDHTVRVGAINAYTGDAYAEDVSLWEVITDMGAVLSFNSQNTVLHTFSNPEDVPFTPDDETGKGFQGDYEFVITEAPESGEYIMLKGKKNGSYNRLTRLEEPTDFEEYIKDVKAFQNKLFSPSAPNHNVITTGGERHRMIMAQNGGDLGLTKTWAYDSDSTFTKVLNPMLVTRHGTKEAGYTYNVRFRSHIAEGDNADKEFVYDADADIFRGVTNPENTIVGGEPYVFFTEAWSVGHKFQMVRSSEGSDSFKTILEAIYQGYRDIKYTFQNVQILKNEDGAQLVVNYRTNKSAAGSVRYNFTYSESDNKVTFAYVEPANTASETQMKSITAINDLVNALNGTFEVEAGASRFNLSTIKLTNAAANSWVVVSYVK